MMTQKQLKAARAALGMTQATCAAALDINPRTYRRYEGGECTIPTVIELSMDWLLTKPVKNED